MGVKSPFFRRWFGDWRSEDKSPVKVLDIKAGEINTKTRSITNSDINRKIKIESQVFNDSIYYARKHKDEKAIKSLLSNIDSIIANSVLLNSEISENNKGSKKGNTLLMHHFYVGVEYNKAPFIAEVIVEEYLDNFNDLKSRVYNVQRIKMSGLPRGHYDALNNASKAEKVRLQPDEITISDLFSLVKTYDKDFKPKPNSLVLNEDGTPKVMYRGDAEEFTVFDRKKSKYSNLYGRGFYFTDSKAHAMQYGNAREFYLNIRNPLKPNQHKITQSQLTKFLELVAEDEDYDIYNYGTTNVSEIVNSIYGKGDFEMLQDVSATAIGDLVETIELFNAVNNTDYDGVILPTETVVYNPNNIKSVKNGGTFSSWDDDILSSKESTDDSSVENIDPGVQDTTAEVEAAYFELKKEVQKKLEEHNKKYGTMKKGMMPARDIDIPNKVSNDRRVRRYARSEIESEVVTNKMAESLTEALVNGDPRLTYNPMSNKKLMSRAEVDLQTKGYEQMKKEWFSHYESNQKITAQFIANAELLLVESQRNGDVETYAKLLLTLPEIGTEAGQVVQALSIIKRLPGAESLAMIDSIIGRVQTIKNRVEKGKAKAIEVPDELKQKYVKAKDKEVKENENKINKAKEKVVDAVANQVDGFGNEELCRLIQFQLGSSIGSYTASVAYAAAVNNSKTGFQNGHRTGYII